MVILPLALSFLICKVTSELLRYEQALKFKNCSHTSTFSWEVSIGFFRFSVGGGGDSNLWKRNRTLSTKCKGAGPEKASASYEVLPSSLLGWQH
jgi:hypothetical protein